MLAEINIFDSYFFGLEGFIIIAVIVVLSSVIAHFRKKVSGKYLIEKIEQLDQKTYQHIANVPFQNLEQKIDHIILSTYGIFIIERKNYNGQIFGDLDDQQWVFQAKKNKKPIDNPITTLEKKIAKIAEELDLKEKNIYPIIAFSNSAKLRVNQKLINQFVVNYDQISDAIQFHKTPKLSNEKIAQLYELLKAKMEKV